MEALLLVNHMDINKLILYLFILIHFNLFYISFNTKSIVSDDNYNLICHILKMSNKLGWLILVSLKIRKLSECLDLLELLNKCFNIKWIVLEYNYWDMENEWEEINIAIKKSIRKLGFIEVLELKKCKTKADSAYSISDSD